MFCAFICQVSAQGFFINQFVIIMAEGSRKKNMNSFRTPTSKRGNCSSGDAGADPDSGTPLATLEWSGMNMPPVQIVPLRYLSWWL